MSHLDPEVFFPVRPNIIAVDDDYDNLKQIVDMLSALEFDVRPALNSDAALQAIRFLLPDLILLDIQMPEMSGFDLCRILKSSQETCNIPVIFLSGKNQEEHINEAFQCGAVDYITKPIKELELISRVKTHLNLAQITQNQEMLVQQRTNQLQKNTRQLEQEIERQNELRSELNESEKNHRQVVDSLLESIGVIDPDGYILFANQKLTKNLTGGIHTDIKEKNLRMFLTDDQTENIIENIRATISNQQKRFEEINITMGHKNRWFNSQMQPVIFGPHSLQAVLYILLDKTEQKSYEHELDQKKKDLQRLSIQLINTQEKERRIISRELHDEVGQALTAVHLNMESIEKLLGPQCLERVKGRLTESIELNGQILSQIREICLNLRPSMLDDLGIVPTLNWYITHFTKRSDLSISFTHQNLKKRMPPEMETTFYRAVQETLVNIVKHARANQVKIKLEKFETLVYLSITDDGVGFDFKGLNSIPEPNRGIGLIGLRERVEMLGGSFSIESEVGKGTNITLSLPD